MRRRRRGRRIRGDERTFLSLFFTDLLKAGLVLLLLHAFIVQFSVVRGSSMLPNIRNGDRLLVDRLSYALQEVDRFDVVILSCPRELEVDYVKRIVGLPGDEIRLQNGQIFVNDELLPEPFQCIPDHDTTETWIVPWDSYFVLGDNRPVSSDSREGWFVNRTLIKGKVRACVWPLANTRVF